MNLNQDASMLDKQLARLAGETTLEERFDILKTLVEYWYDDIDRSDAYSPEELNGISLPVALKKWFLWAGKYETIMSGQDFLLGPSKIDTSRNPFIFHEENQYCCVWATTTEEEDPHIYFREDDEDPWLLQNTRVSEHLILTCIFESILHRANYRVRADRLGESDISFLRQHIPKVPLSPWPWLETTFYAGENRFMFTSKVKHSGITSYNVWIGSQTEKPLRFLKERDDVSWDYC